MNHKLSIPEEILLLSIDKNGDIPNHRTFEIVIAASILMELEYQKKIDSDLDKVVKVNNAHTDDIVVNTAVELIFCDMVSHDPDYYISQIAIQYPTYIELIINGLVKKNILKVEDKKILWISTGKKYTIIDNTELTLAKLRIREAIFNSEIPSEKDIIVISILNYVNFLDLVFTDDEINKYNSEIIKIAKMNLIGQAIAQTLIHFYHYNTIINKPQKINTPNEKLDYLIKQTKQIYNIEHNDDLPDWLKKGTQQYEKTLELITKTGRIDIYFDEKTGEYGYKDNYYSAGVVGNEEHKL